MSTYFALGPGFSTLSWLHGDDRSRTLPRYLCWEPSHQDHLDSNEEIFFGAGGQPRRVVDLGHDPCRSWLLFVEQVVGLE